ncbi:MAG: hypothetical protein KDA79_15940 [Planctomycetaceae bacterium]|nr:hypothetical protein [Planctomycetaceae bacterium]
MQTSLRITACFSILLTSGCFVQSLNPLVDDTVTCRDARLPGTWVLFDDVFDISRKDHTWTITEAADDSYRLTASMDGKTSEYTLRIMKARDYLIADMVKSHSIDEEFRINSVRVHQLLKLSIEKGELRTASLIPARNFQSLARKHHLAYSTVDGRTILTASTGDLQEFFLEHGEAAFADFSTTFKRSAP